MVEPELRLLAAAAALEQFTVAELSDAADCNLHTTKSWLRRMAHLLVTEAKKPTGRGRPRHMLTLRPEGMRALRERMAELQLHLTQQAPALDHGTLIDEVNRQFDLWKSTHAYLPAAAEGALIALQVSLHSTWRTIARLDALGECVSNRVIWTMAEIEAEAGIVMPALDIGWTERARWMAERLARIIAQDATHLFAERVSVARLETRPGADKATCAALAAPVWSDEGHADGELGETDWQRCLRIAELIPLERRLERVELVLIEIDGLGSQYDGDAQAIVRGLTACDKMGSTARYRDWLGAAKGRPGWRDALAPMIVHGLSECDATRLSVMAAPFRPVLEVGMASYEGVVGRLRHTALRRAAQHAQMAPPAEMPEVDINLFGSQTSAALSGEL